MKRFLAFFLVLLMAAGLTAPAHAEDLAVDARACLLMEKSTGQVLYAVNEHEKLEPASVTKAESVLI